MSFSQENDKDFIIDDENIIEPEEVLEQTVERTKDELEALPYQLTKTQLTEGQKANRSFHLKKTMKEKFNVPESKWKRFLHPSIREKFLHYVRETGSLTGAVVKLRKRQEFDIAASTVKNLINRFPTFGLMYEEAIEEYKFCLEEEAKRRAVDGVDEAVYYQGEVCGYQKKYSDSLLSKLLEANVGKYQKKSAGGSNTFNGPIQINIKKDFG